MRAWAAGLLALAFCLPAASQERSSERSAEERCLRHIGGPDAEPVFPPLLYQANRGGRVQVELQFDRPDTAPTARVLLHEGDDSLVDSVREHLRGLRVPCMGAHGTPVLLRQEYVFARDERRVHWTRPQYVGRTGSEELWACLKRPANPHEYPTWAAREGVQGRVLLRLHFERPDTPPRVETFSRTGARRLATEAARWAQDHRLPCLGAQPATTLMTFVYRLGDDRYGFNEQLTLVQALSASRGIRERGFVMDTTTMACPFELRFEYRRPELPNLVGEPGEPVPARRPLLEWLEQFEFDLPEASADAVWGDRVKLAVPCVKINVKPKEK